MQARAIAIQNCSKRGYPEVHRRVAVAVNHLSAINELKREKTKAAKWLIYVLRHIHGNFPTPKGYKEVHRRFGKAINQLSAVSELKRERTKAAKWLLYLIKHLHRNFPIPKGYKEWHRRIQLAEKKHHAGRQLQKERTKVAKWLLYLINHIHNNEPVLRPKDRPVVLKIRVRISGPNTKTPLLERLAKLKGPIYFRSQAQRQLTRSPAWSRTMTVHLDPKAKKPKSCGYNGPIITISKPTRIPRRKRLWNPSERKKMKQIQDKLSKAVFIMNVLTQSPIAVAKALLWPVTGRIVTAEEEMNELEKHRLRKKSERERRERRKNKLLEELIKRGMDEQFKDPENKSRMIDEAFKWEQWERMRKTGKRRS
tara:strand:- start:413 stop:1513 length:1101 start_codon:yes stop_codon:yes gene_type:complete